MPRVQQIILRPSRRDLGWLKAIIVAGILMFLGIPVVAASDHYDVTTVAIMAALCIPCVVATVHFGRQGLDMRIEVGPDAVRIYPWLQKRITVRRASIADVQVGVSGSYYAPYLILINGDSYPVVPLSARTEGKAEERAAELRLALRDVASAD